MPFVLAPGQLDLASQLDGSFDDLRPAAQEVEARIRQRDHGRQFVGVLFQRFAGEHERVHIGCAAGLGRHGFDYLLSPMSDIDHQWPAAAIDVLFAMLVKEVDAAAV